MVILAYDVQGEILCHFVPHGETVNAQYFTAYLQNHLRLAVRRKRPQLHDTATPHKAICVRDLLRRWRWEVLDHSPYSQDLSPWDYDLIPKLKAPLRGTDFVPEMTLPLQFDAWLWLQPLWSRWYSSTSTSLVAHNWESLGLQYFEGL